MTDKHDFLDDQELDAMLGALVDDAPQPSDALMARILADAEEFRVVPGALVQSANESFIESVLSLLGGWKGASGLVTAGVIGLWIGVSPPMSLETTTSEIWEIVSPDPTGGWSDYDGIL